MKSDIVQPASLSDLRTEQMPLFQAVVIWRERAGTDSLPEKGPFLSWALEQPPRREI